MFFYLQYSVKIAVNPNIYIYILWFTISIHVTHVRPYAALGSRAVSRPLAAHCSEPNCLPPPQGSPWEVPPLPSLRPVAKRAVRGGKDGSAV